VKGGTAEKSLGRVLIETVTPAGFVRRQIQPRTPLPGAGASARQGRARLDWHPAAEIFTPEGLRPSRAL